jgi:hypothetical protein
MAPQPLPTDLLPSPSVTSTINSAAAADSEPAASANSNNNNNNSNDDMFSPTSAAAMALSTLHHFGTDQTNHNSNRTGSTPWGSNTTQPKKLFSSSATKTASNTISHTHSRPHHNNNNYHQPIEATATAIAITSATVVTAPRRTDWHQPPYPPETASLMMSAGTGTGGHVDAAGGRRASYAHDYTFGGVTGAGATGGPVPVPSSTSVARYHSYQQNPHHEDSSYMDVSCHLHFEIEFYILFKLRFSSTPFFLTHLFPALFFSLLKKSTPANTTGRPCPQLSTSTGDGRHNKRYDPLEHLASCASTLVTPTPKKTKHGEHPTTTTASAPSSASAYSRKKKSLGVLAENFINSYEDKEPGTIIVVDEAAIHLGVERRRIYDVVNILEAIALVTKKHKNTYSWLGKGHLDNVFGRLQAQAIVEYPQDAKTFGLINDQDILNLPSAVDDSEDPAGEGSSASSSSSVSSFTKSQAAEPKAKENKSLARLSQEFLQVFLVGHQTLSLPEASDKIQGATSVEELIAMGLSTEAKHMAVLGSSHQNKTSRNASFSKKNPKELKAAAARGLKTKIRRLYDIANVFLSVGLLKKVDSGDSSRRPNFSWAYKLTQKEIHDMHNNATPIKRNCSSSSSSSLDTTTNDGDDDEPPAATNQQHEESSILSNPKAILSIARAVTMEIDAKEEEIRSSSSKTNNDKDDETAPFAAAGSKDPEYGDI